MRSPHRRPGAVLVFLLAFGVQSLHAAPHANPPPPPAFEMSGAGWPGGQESDLRLAFMAMAMASEKTVKGAPYSAVAVSEFHQTLADGNRIARSRTSLLFRDSEGRTRQEMGGEHVMIFLNDAPTGRRILLDPERKLAILLNADSHPGEKSPTDLLGTIGSVMQRAWSRVSSATGLAGPAHADRPDVNPAPAERGMDGPPLAMAPWQGGERPGPPEPHPGPGGPGGPGGPPPGAFQAHPPFVFHEPRGRGVVTPLGAKDFDGVHADGTRTSWTIPPGQVGNEKPIELISDQWYAPDLLLVVNTREYDPRDGESTYQIKELKRAEPSAELFTVPADFTLVSAAKFSHPLPH